MERLLTNTIYQFMFENSYEAILLAQPDGRVYRANPAACGMFQRAEEEICHIGRPGLADMNDPRLEPALEERRNVMKYAVIVVSSLPVMIIYPFVQRFFVKGVMIGAVKG